MDGLAPRRQDNTNGMSGIFNLVDSYRGARKEGMIDLILLCFGTASLALFLDMCMEKNMVLRWYYNWITYWFCLPRKQVILGFTTILYKPVWDTLVKKHGLEYVEALVRLTKNNNDIHKYCKNKYLWLWKMLGGCCYCFGTWVHIIISGFITYNRSLTPEFIGLFLLGIGINYFFIKSIDRIWN